MIVYEKPRHPESQGAVERANLDIKDALFTIMQDNSNDEYISGGSVAIEH